MDTSTTNQARAAENELRVLRAIGLIGWLSASQIAKWVWGDHNAHSARVCADKVLKRLVESGHVKRRESSLRMFVYILTKAGAIRANEGQPLELFRHGYDLSQLDSARQRPVVDYLIAQSRENKVVLGIAAVRKGLEVGFFNGLTVNGIDGFVFDPVTQSSQFVLLVRNTHPELIKKVKRLQREVGQLNLIFIGSPSLVSFFERT
jgi:hypothetical protein